MTDRWWWDATWGERWRRGSEHVRLTWPTGEAVASLFDEGVPATAAAFVRRLPLEIGMVHVAWSGDMLMGAEKLPLGELEKENVTRLPQRGDVGFDPLHDELTITYGTAECRLPSGENTICVFGSIVENLPAFASFARARRFEGVGMLRITRC
jgi:hypothetical protein